jgi:hypothetical protein
MSRLWTPPSVSRELRQETERENADLLSMAQHRDVINEFNPELKKIDLRLELVWFDGDADAAGVIPNRYHLLRIDAGVPTSVTPLCDENGGFIEPNSGLFEWLQRSDLWNAAAKRDQVKARDEARKAAERRKEREQEDRIAELKDRYNAKFRTSISLNDSTPWAQNQHGRRGRTLNR